MAFNIAQIVNRVLKTDNTGAKQRIRTRTGNLAAASEDFVLDINKPIIIDYLEFVTDSLDKGMIRLAQYTTIPSEYTEPLSLLTYAGTIGGFTPANVNRDSSALVRIELFDTTNNRYKLSVSNLAFPSGLKLSVVNNNPDTTQIVAGVVCRYREM